MFPRSLKFIVDIDTDLKQFQSLEIHQDKFVLCREFFVIDNKALSGKVDTTIQGKYAWDIVDLLMRKRGILDRQRAVLLDKQSEYISML